MEIEFLLKLGYYLGISPIRFCRGETYGKIKTSRIRKVICSSLHISGLLLSLLLCLYPQMKTGLKSRSPTFLFSIAFTLTSQCHISSAWYILWYRREGLRNVIVELGKLGGGKEQDLGVTKFLLVLGTLLPLGFMLYPGDDELFGPGAGLLGCPYPNKTFTYVPLMRWTRTLAYWEKECTQHPAAVIRILLGVQFWFYLYFCIAWGFTYSMLMASSFSVYRIAANLYSTITGAPDCPKDIILNYELMKCRIGMVNQVLHLSPFLAVLEFVIFVSIILPWTLSSFDPIASIDISISTLVLAALLIAAEANRLMGEVARFIISSFPHDAANVSLTLANSHGDWGIKGWHFFTISYNFVACVGSAIFTYVLVVIQFPH